jgi:hypothetical protein
VDVDFVVEWVVLAVSVVAVVVEVSIVLVVVVVEVVPSDAVSVCVPQPMVIKQEDAKSSSNTLNIRIVPPIP